MKINLVEESIASDFNKSIWTKFNRAVEEYQLIQEGDNIAVCISGGKDSMLLALCMERLRRFSGGKFSLQFLGMDPGYKWHVKSQILKNAEKLGIPLILRPTRIFESADKAGKHPCFLCSRLRRGWLYKTANEIGCNKIALGHHFDDVIETILMGMLYGSQMQTMMPKLHSENYAGMELIRPLYLVREADIIRWGKCNHLHFIQCACGVSETNENRGTGSKRQEIKELLAQLRETNPAVDMNIFRSAENVNLQTLISYHIGDERHHFLDNYSEGRTIRGTISKKPETDTNNE
ncbi:MAG: tRNA 2-thiocytidine biosynthesis protein TtcA [Ruminococcus sp.]|nr:tRNA 2-thiocytidine biosynthesis protein TtcA [Ruminococcus sp.]